MAVPNKDEKFPLQNYNRLCFLKNIITNPNIIVGDYTYCDDFEDVHNFENNVKYIPDGSISIKELVGNPEKYNGKIVQLYKVE